MPDFEAQIKATLDSSDAESKINSFVNKKYGPINVDVNLNLSKSSQSIANLINQFKQQGQAAASSFAASFNGGLGKLDVSKFTSSLNNIKVDLGKLGFNSSEIDNITNKLEKMKISVTGVTTSLNSNGGLNLKIQGVDEIGRAVTMTNNYSKANKELSSSISAVAKAEQQISGTKLATASNNFDAWVAKNSESIGQFSGKVDELKRRMESMKSIGASASAFNEWQSELKELQSEISKTRSEVASLDGLKISSNNFTAWCNENGKAVKAYGEQIENLKKQMQDMQQNGATVAQAKNWDTQVSLLQSQAKAENNIGKTFGQEMSAAFGSAMKFASSYVSIYKVFSTIQDGMKTIVGLDDALVDLQKTTTASFDELDQFYREANDIAKQYGTSTQQVIQGAADWSRLGYNLEDSKLMSKLSSQFAAISPGMSVDKATESLVSTMKAFGFEAEDVLDGVMSKVNKMGKLVA